MTTLIVILLSGIINRWRGWGLPKSGAFPAWLTWLDRLGGKFYCSAYMGLLFGLYTLDHNVGLIVAAGFALWALLGWGDYWDYTEKPNDEVWFIDAVVGRFFKPGAVADFVSMSLRGILLGYPLFIGLAVYLGSAWPLLIGLGMAAQGPIYHVFFRLLQRQINWITAFIITEFAMGCWIGAVIAAALAMS